METVIDFSTVDMEMSVARDLVKRVQSDVVWNAPPAGVTVKITGSMEMFAAVMDDISESRTYMTMIGFAFILGFLIMVYRKFGLYHRLSRSSSS
ncbi:MAG: MMPL family transporter [Methanoculleus sp.]